MQSTATQPEKPADAKPSRIPPEIRVKIIDGIMELRTILSEPDEAKARAAAEALVSKIETIED